MVVIDYGMGNVYSVLSALQYLGATPELTSDPEKILRARHIVLPGVGSFRNGMNAIKSRNLDKHITNAVKAEGTNILGICLGMQLLGSVGFEGGETAGLGLIPNEVRFFDEEKMSDSEKVPHVGFNLVRTSRQEGLFQDLPEEADFYFTHSYRMKPDNLEGNQGLCEYGETFLATFEAGNICGAQFHPEKSQTNGLILMRNFLRK